ncbi:MAG: UDP-3-O-acyl-N-acetylglucosamine deacetylase [Chlamydiia bacterium]
MKRIDSRPQTTILNVFELTGIALFTGKIVRCRFLPALPETGILFRRVDLLDKSCIQAKASTVVSTPRCTVIGQNGITVQLVEHLLSAVYGLGIDNLIIEIDGPEVPIFDGSSKEFTQALIEAKTVSLAAQKPIFKLMAPLEVVSNGTVVRAVPADELSFSYLLNYDDKGVLEHQEYGLRFNHECYLKQVSNCRTFSSYEEIQPLLEKGFIKGGSLDNGIIVKEGRVINEGGLRFSNEMARHKVLDMIGDLCLIGYDVIASYEGDRSGHAQTTKLAQIIEEKVLEWVHHTPQLVHEWAKLR